MVKRQSDTKPTAASRRRRLRGALTLREHELVAEILAGRTNKDIAQRSGVGEQTIRNQLCIVYAKLGVSNRLQLATRLMNRRSG
jgi:DNA-binding CsgD family transcriptional regulator